MRDASVAGLALGTLGLLGCSDTRPPRFDEGAAPALRAEGDRVEVSWPAAADDREVTSYVVEVDGTEVARGPERSHTLSGLPELASPRVTVRALDAAGHASEPITAQITLADRTPPRFSPEARVELVPSETPRSVTVVWTAASDNVAVVSYEVRRDGAVAGTTTEPRLELRDLPDHGVLEIVALDAEGLRSAPLISPAWQAAPAGDERTSLRDAAQARAWARVRAELAERSGADLSRILAEGERSQDELYGAPREAAGAAPADDGANAPH